MNGRSGSATAIDAATGKVAGDDPDRREDSSLPCLTARAMSTSTCENKSEEVETRFEKTDGFGALAARAVRGTIRACH